jgi:hypothetical protein
MQNIREIIRKILSDDAIYRRKDLPGDIDDPPATGGCGCSGSCKCDDDFVTARYALFSLIREAIDLYDGMSGDETGIPELDEKIVEMARAIKKLRN